MLLDYTVINSGSLYVVTTHTHTKRIARNICLSFSRQMYINILGTYNTICKQQYSQTSVKIIVFASCIMLHAKITDRMRLQLLPKSICVCNCNDVSVLHDDIRRRFSILSISFRPCSRVIFSYLSASITRMQFFKESRRIPVENKQKSPSIFGTDTGVRERFVRTNSVSILLLFSPVEKLWEKQKSSLRADIAFLACNFEKRDKIILQT